MSISCMLIGALCLTPQQSRQITQIIETVVQVESDGDPMAYNRHEKAVGAGQIRPIMLRELNEIIKRNGGKRVLTEADCYSLATTKWAMRVYYLDRLRKAQDAGHQTVTAFDLAATWNTGRTVGFRKPTENWQDRFLLRFPARNGASGHKLGTTATRNKEL